MVMFSNNVIKKLGLFIACFTLISCIDSYAQNVNSFKELREKMLKEFQQARASQRETFNQFREKINKEYAALLSKEWQESKVEETPIEPEPEPVPKPEPKPVYVPIPGVKSVPIPFTLSDRTPKISPKIKPIEPIFTDHVEPDNILPEIDKVIIPGQDVVILATQRPDIPRRPYEPEKNNYIGFTFYGNECKVRLPEKKEYSVPSADNKLISQAWEVLSGETYNDMLVDMLCIRESLSLCDWAFFQLTQQLTNAYFGSHLSADASIMQTYILSQLGFKVRLVKQDENLFPIIAFAETVYGAKFLPIGNDKYYIFRKTPPDAKYFICDFEFPGERACSVAMKEIMSTPASYTQAKEFKSLKYPDLKVTIKPNKNTIDFLDKYVDCSWEYKAMASLSQDIKEQLYPTLKKVIAGKSQEEAANILINFVQTGFEYQTDDQQFGHERSLFADETFFYPYSDCEDRSILYSTLVRDLLGLEVVLLDYPGHIATAVHFTSDIDGDFFEYDGKKFIVCDPTYVGASIGRTMPEMKSLECSVIELK